MYKICTIRNDNNNNNNNHDDGDNNDNDNNNSLYFLRVTHLATINSQVANSADLVQMPHSVTSGLGLHCLLIACLSVPILMIITVSSDLGKKNSSLSEVCRHLCYC